MGSVDFAPSRASREKLKPRLHRGGKRTRFGAMGISRMKGFAGLVLAAAAFGLASCAGQEKAGRPTAAQAGFRTLIAGEAAALDRLEKAARGCRLKGVRRERSPERLSFDTPAGEPRPGDPFHCFIEWTKRHPETAYQFVGNAPRE